MGFHILVFLCYTNISASITINCWQLWSGMLYLVYKVKGGDIMTREEMEMEQARQDYVTAKTIRNF